MKEKRKVMITFTIFAGSVERIETFIRGVMKFITSVARHETKVEHISAKIIE